MWRNSDVVDFVRWLHGHNADLLPGRRAGVFGLDLYSLRASMEAVVTYLARVDSAAAARARRSYACFDMVGDPAEYGLEVRLGLQPSCRDDVTRELLALRRAAEAYARRDGTVAEDEYFYAEQNARVAKDAEEYYRTMLDSRVSSWNLRDTHMMETLDRLRAHLRATGRGARVVVWAHNSHVGDAKATDMSRRAEVNLGSLARERYGNDCVLIGATTYEGTVSAASDWGGPVERKIVRPALPGSVEALFHATGRDRFVLALNDATALAALEGPMLERAIGVIYRPDTERQSHYFYADVASQFDAVVHIDRTHAVEPLDRTPMWDTGEVPETYPSGV
jgi:erythromycin esterase-like protein